MKCVGERLKESYVGGSCGGLEEKSAAALMRVKQRREDAASSKSLADSSRGRAQEHLARFAEKKSHSDRVRQEFEARIRLEQCEIQSAREAQRLEDDLALRDIMALRLAKFGHDEDDFRRVLAWSAPTQHNTSMASPRTMSVAADSSIFTLQEKERITCSDIEAIRGLFSKQVPVPVPHPSAGVLPAKVSTWDGADRGQGRTQTSSEKLAMQPSSPHFHFDKTFIQFG